MNNISPAFVYIALNYIICCHPEGRMTEGSCAKRIFQRKILRKLSMTAKAVSLLLS